MRFLALILALSFFSSTVRAQECAAPSKCYDAETRKQVMEALDELDAIHKNPAQVQVLDPIVVIRDWDGRVYVNGGVKVPLRMKLKIAPSLERDLVVNVQPRVYTREKPADPMFRFRLRAQLGVLARGTYDRIKNGGSWPLDGGLAADFFHLGPVNVSLYAGIFSAGPQIGLDLTKNFGIALGYSMVYLKPAQPDFAAMAYFAFW